MTPHELRDRIGEYEELLDGHKNFSQLREQVLKILVETPNAYCTLDATYGIVLEETFTVPLADIVPVLTRRIAHFEAKIGAIK